MAKSSNRTHSSINQRNILRFAALLALCIGTPALAGAPYWHTYGGLIFHGLSVDMTDGATPFDELSLRFSSAGGMRIEKSGLVEVLPIAGAYYGVIGAAAQSATMQVQGGDRSGFASFTAQNSDWGQNIQSMVTRARTVSYVVNLTGTDTFYVAGAGWIYASGAYYASDGSLKTDINMIDNPLDKVMRLQGVTYRRKDLKPCDNCRTTAADTSDHRVEMGFVAQDVEKVVPEVVRTVADGTKAVAYQNLVALLVEAVKTQQGQLNSQARQIAVLQHQVALLGGTGGK